ncbi:HlyU family transcriptional regulator [Curvivirga sp.]|uniref:HlyU family transcriptional regulator n=1 Tax=Curvivirga sp. TaxID=2856848 RepID=UPI003B5AC03F
MSFFSKLFGGGEKEPEAAKREEPEIYEGYKIIAAPIPAENKQWRLAGVIVKTTDDGDLEREYIRADVFYSREEAIEFALSKGKQVIDQQGDRIFADGAKTGRC